MLPNGSITSSFLGLSMTARGQERPMPAEFVVVIANSGVESHPPRMIVPRGSSNIVGLTGPANLRLVTKNPNIRIKEISAGSLFSDVMHVLLIILGGTRLFRISGNVRVGKDGALVHAVRPGSSSKPEASLYVTVLDQRRVRLAIRPVQVRAQGSNSVGYHSKLPLNAEEACADMNAIWTPQANIVFELTSKAVAVPTEEAIKTVSHGAKTLRKQLDPDTVAPVFKALVTPDVDFTIFRVESVWPDGWREPVLGKTFSKDRFALVGDNGLIPSQKIDPLTKKPKINVRRVMPHEAGHWLGDPQEKWDAHRGATDPNWLMTLGGTGINVPVAETLTYFNTNY